MHTQLYAYVLAHFASTVTCIYDDMQITDLFNLTVKEGCDAGTGSLIQLSIVASTLLDNEFRYELLYISSYSFLRENK